ncbi:MAG: SpoIIIAH-like family protein [Ruminococcaceae bacterium]|nr:SpoIIIAH-like family protein [Oscillospiraceae bacterium]
MEIRKTWEKTKKIFLKIGKRNAMIGCSVLLIGTAIVLNLIIFGGAEKSSGFDYSAAVGMTGSNSVGADAADGQSEGDSANYFATSQVNRQRARDEAMEVLQSVVDNESADAAAKEKAIGEIEQIAADMKNESNIETLVVSKGFEKCVAVVSGGSVSVIVKGEELLDTQISQINEIVYEQTGILPENVKIIRK